VWQITGILSFALVLSLAGFKLYYDKVEAEKNQMKSALEQSQKNESLLKESIDSLNQEIDERLRKEEENFKKIEELSKEISAARQETDRIKKTFAKHDLNYLSLKKPKLIEGVINKGTAKVNEELENITNPSVD
jgi:peptidoglycan hydrolase CwlO-like protein